MIKPGNMPALDQQVQVLADHALAMRAAIANLARPVPHRLTGSGKTNDYVKAIGLGLWQSGEAKRDRGDQNGYQRQCQGGRHRL